SPNLSAAPRTPPACVTRSAAFLPVSRSCFPSTAADLARRDRLDSTRKVNPLAQAPDAVVLDTTELGIDEVVARLRDLLTERGVA
ncbi:(d)CMP kinase, partial [Micromonospora sp. NPDC005113]